MWMGRVFQREGAATEKALSCVKEAEKIDSVPNYKSNYQPFFFFYWRLNFPPV